MTYTRTGFCRLFAACVGTLLAVCAALLFDRRDVLSIDPSKSFIEPVPAILGAAINVVWNAKANRNCGGIVIPRFYDKNDRIYEYAHEPVIYHDIINRHSRTFTKVRVLPQVMPEGAVRYEAVVVRWCNFMQQHFWPMIDRPMPIHFVVKAP